MDKNYDINTLISKMLTGDINEEESEALLQKAEKSQELKTKIQELMEADDFVKRYRQYRSIDADGAKEKFMSSMVDSTKNKQRNAKLVWLRSIAAAAVFIGVVVAVGWGFLRPQPKARVITAEMHQAIERVEQSGMNGATLIIGGKTITVKDAKSAMAQAEQIAEETEASTTDEITEGSLVTKKDKEFWMVLDDGTYVHLNYNTTLIYPNHFVGSERKVKLKGEAYFAVAKDSKKRPFIVETANGDVHDYGTEFNVNTTKEEGVTSVVLVKGKVGVSSKHGKEYLLKPGEMATLQAGRTPNINKVDVSLYTSWNTGNFFFDGCTLSDLMDVISHWYNMKVEYSTDDIKDIQFTGSIDKYEPMAPTLNAIENITGLKIAAKDGIISIRRNE